jgi:hypothetical protein
MTLTEYLLLISNCAEVKKKERIAEQMLWTLLVRRKKIAKRTRKMDPLQFTELEYV